MTQLVSKTKAWKKLGEHYKHIKDVKMRDMFEYDEERAKKFTVQFENLMLDYSKKRINERTM